MDQRYDKAFKSLAEDDPRALLHLLGSLPADVAAEVTPVEREIVPRAFRVDHAYRIRAGGDEWIVILEALTHWTAEILPRLASYCYGLGGVSGLPVRCVLALLVEDHAPRVVPDSHRVAFGDLTLTLRLRVVRLWELDAGTVLAEGRVSLYPWVPLLDHGREQLEEAARRLHRANDGGLKAQFGIFGGLRYKQDWPDLLGRLTSMFPITEEMVRESGWIDILRKRAEEISMEKGRLEEGRRYVRRVIASRFPGLGQLPELDQIEDPERLEAMFDEILRAETAEAALASIQRHSR